MNLDNLNKKICPFCDKEMEIIGKETYRCPKECFQVAYENGVIDRYWILRRDLDVNWQYICFDLYKGNMLVVIGEGCYDLPIVDFSSCSTPEEAFEMMRECIKNYGAFI